MKKLLLILLVSLSGKTMFAQDLTDQFLDSVMQVHHIPGAAVAIVQDGEIIKKSVYGKANLEWDLPVKTYSPFQLASVTKVYTGVLLGKMQEIGMISLDDSLGKYLDSLPEKWQAITIRQLAAHQSGIKMVQLENYSTLPSAIQAALGEDLDYEPGTEEYYVSTDYAFINLILEKISGKSFPGLMDELVLQPLGLKNTGFDQLKEGGLFRSANLIPHRVAVYGWSETGHFISDMRFPDWFYPAGGIYSSIDDMVRFIQVLDQGKFITQTTQDLIFGPNALVNGKESQFGLGWITENYQGHRLTGHSGGPALADVIRFPDQELSIMVLTNRRGGFYPFLSRAIARFYVKGLAMPEIPQ